MINVNTDFLNKQNAAFREVRSKIELYHNSSLETTFNDNDKIVSYEIQKTGDKNKFWGYYVSQRINLKLVNYSGSISSGWALKPYLGYNTNLITYPLFYITEINRNETFNELSVTGYDALYTLAKYNYGNLGLTGAQRPLDILNKICYFINSNYNSCVTKRINSGFNTYFDGFAADTDLKTVLINCLEVLGAIAFLNNDNRLTVVSFTSSDSVDKTITEDYYSSYNNKDNKRLTNVEYTDSNGTVYNATTGYTGSSQRISNNYLIEQGNIQNQLNALITYLGNTTINQFELSAFGNLEVEIGDKLAISYGSNTAYSYYLDYTVQFNGGLAEKLQWAFEADQNTSAGVMTINDKFEVNNGMLIEIMEDFATEINGADGGYVSILDCDNDGNPDNIFITDVEISASDVVYYNGAYVLSNNTYCTSVLRINQNGLGISSGYQAGTASNGYRTAITGSGILADCIYTGVIHASNSGNYWNLNSSKFVSGNANGSLVIHDGAADWHDANDNRVGAVVVQHYPDDSENFGIEFNKDVCNYMWISSVNTDGTQWQDIVRIYDRANEGGQLETYGTQFSGYLHRRTFNNHSYWIKAGVGTAYNNTTPTASLELTDSDSTTILARLDVASPSYTNGVAKIRVQSDYGGTSSWWELTNDRKIIDTSGNTLQFKNDGLYYNGNKLAFA